MSAAMSALLAAFMAAFPRAVIAILAKFASEAVLQAYLEKLIVSGLRAASKYTQTTVDDELVDMVEARLKEQVTEHA